MFTNSLFGSSSMITETHGLTIPEVNLEDIQDGIYVVDTDGAYVIDKDAAFIIEEI